MTNINPSIRNDIAKRRAKQFLRKTKEQFPLNKEQMLYHSLHNTPPVKLNNPKYQKRLMNMYKGIVKFIKMADPKTDKVIGSSPVIMSVNNDIIRGENDGPDFQDTCLFIDYPAPNPRAANKAFTYHSLVRLFERHESILNCSDHEVRLWLCHYSTYTFDYVFNPNAPKIDFTKSAIEVEFNEVKGRVVLPKVNDTNAITLLTKTFV